MGGIINCPRPNEPKIAPIARFLDELKHDRTAMKVAGFNKPRINFVLNLLEIEI